MGDAREIGEQLSIGLETAGWGFWADTSKPEPFPMWLTRPGVPPFMMIEDTAPATFVRELDEFNPIESRLNDTEVDEVVEAIGTSFVCRAAAVGVLGSEVVDELEVLDEFDGFAEYVMRTMATPPPSPDNRVPFELTEAETAYLHGEGPLPDTPL